MKLVIAADAVIYILQMVHLFIGLINITACAGI